MSNLLGWKELRPHDGQKAFLRCGRRFVVCPAGRRSGKTEIAKRRLILRALLFPRRRGRFVAAAPTHSQAKAIFWDDIRDMVPDDAVSEVSYGELWIKLVTGTRIWVCGLDRPERVEGPPLDGIVMDEYGNMKEETWPEHVRPALSTPGRLGWADFIGVPEGRNHYYDLAQHAQDPANEEWAYFSWHSADVIDPGEVLLAKEELDPRTYRQEYEASFESFANAAYYAFEREAHVGGYRGQYDPRADLLVALDFNVSPGVASIAQELGNVLTIVGEVYIRDNSTTYKVCREIGRQWGNHEGRVLVYGDSTGNAGGSAKVLGTDWDLVKEGLDKYFGRRVRIKVETRNPREKDRVAAVNARLRNASGKIGMVVDENCRHTIRDFEGVISDDAGKIDKVSNPKLSHMTDAIGYMVSKRNKKPAKQKIIRL